MHLTGVKREETDPAWTSNDNCHVPTSPSQSSSGDEGAAAYQGYDGLAASGGSPALIDSSARDSAGAFPWLGGPLTITN